MTPEIFFQKNWRVIKAPRISFAVVASMVRILVAFGSVAQGNRVFHRIQNASA